MEAVCSVTINNQEAILIRSTFKDVNKETYENTVFRSG